MLYTKLFDKNHFFRLNNLHQSIFQIIISWVQNRTKTDKIFSSNQYRGKKLKIVVSQSAETKVTEQTGHHVRIVPIIAGISQILEIFLFSMFSFWLIVYIFIATIQATNKLKRI
jgi:hypothetical protein